MNFVRFILIIFFCSLFSGIAFSAEKAPELESLLKNRKWKEVGDLLNKELAEVQKEEVNLKAKTDKILKQEGNIKSAFGSESKSKGIILTFKDWPVDKEKQSILQKLAAAKLAKESEIERFKVWVYKWDGLKEKEEAEKVCKTLFQHLSLKKCQPDYLLNITRYDYIPAAEKQVEGARTGVETARKNVETVRQAFEETEARAGRIFAQMTEDRGLAIEEDRVRRAEAALVTARQKLEQVLQSGKDPKIARWNVQHLEKLIVSRKKRVENRKKWFEGTKKYVTDNQNRLVEARRSALQRAESWLENRLQYLARSERRLADARAKYGNRNNNKEKKNTQSSASSNQANKNITSNTKSTSFPDVVSNSDSNDQNTNLKTCNIVSSQLRLPDPDDKNTLTDYWAQEMVGADLLKEEVEKADPVGKKIVETFDAREAGHASKVRNIISHKGPHSVLPELGNNIGTSHVRYVSDILSSTDRLLNKADEACSASNVGGGGSSSSTGGLSSTGSSSSSTGGSSGAGNIGPIGEPTNESKSSQRRTASTTKEVTVLPKKEVEEKTKNIKLPAGETTNPGGGGSDPGASQQRGSSQQVRGSTVSQQEVVDHKGTEYIILRDWANNRHYELSNIISRFNRFNNGEIKYIDNPYIDELQEAGESWSPTFHAVPNTEENREILKQFVQHRGTTVHNRTLTVMWKGGTNWAEEWQSPIEGGGPSPHHNLVADYEVDRDHKESAPIFYRREYRYIFRPPVLDISFGSTSSTEYFNWLPPIVLAPGNKLKVWGTRVVGGGPLVINGVSVTLTEVSGTISDVPGSSLLHGRFEAVLSSTEYDQILDGRVLNSVNANSNQASSENGNTGGREVHNTDRGTGQNTNGNTHIKVKEKQKILTPKVVSVQKSEPTTKVVIPREWKTPRGNIKVSHSKGYVSVAQLGKYLSDLGYSLSNEIILGSAGPWRNGLLKYKDAVKTIPKLKARSVQLKRDRAKAREIKKKLQGNPYFYLDKQKVKGGSLPGWVEQWKTDNPEKYQNYQNGNY